MVIGGNEVKQINETLYGVEKNGDTKQWSVYVTDNVVTVEWGKVGGKLQTKATVCEAKNVGRSNETSPEQQAILEAESKYRKQLDKYYRPTVEEAKMMVTDGVMLAQDYTKKPHFLDDEFYVSVKLDGLRCKSVYDCDTETLTWESRGGKTYPVPPHIVGPLKHIHKTFRLKALDGEAYIHGEPLQSIQSCVKKHNMLTPEVTYQIFDIPLLDVCLEERILIMNGIKDELLSDCVGVVDQVLIKKEDLETHHSLAVAAGYEGVMTRNKDNEYLFQNKRSNSLLKYKKMFDSEAKVLSCTKDKNGQGKFGMGWTNPEGVYVEFDLSMNGSHEDNTYEKLLERLGEWVSFKYQALTKDGVPTFARGLYFRECNDKGDPLE